MNFSLLSAITPWRHFLIWVVWLAFIQSETRREVQSENYGHNHVYNDFNWLLGLSESYLFSQYNASFIDKIRTKFLLRDYKAKRRVT